MPVGHERSKQETKTCCRLVFIVSTKAHATGGIVRTIFNYMPKHSSYIQNTPVSITIIKIGPFHASMTRKK